MSSICLGSGTETPSTHTPSQIDQLKAGIDQIKNYIGNLEQCHANSLTNVNTDDANRGSPKGTGTRRTFSLTPNFLLCHQGTTR